MYREIGTEIIEGYKVNVFEVKCERKENPSFFAKMEDSFCRGIASVIVKMRRTSKAKAIGLASALGSSVAACVLFVGLSALLF